MERLVFLFAVIVASVFWSLAIVVCLKPRLVGRAKLNRFRKRVAEKNKEILRLKAEISRLRKGPSALDNADLRYRLASLRG